MKKAPKPLMNMLRIYWKDFGSENIFSYEKFETELINSIKNSNKSLNEQKIEAVAIKSQEENSGFVSTSSLIMAFATTILSNIVSFLSLIVSKYQPCETQYSESISIIFGIIFALQIILYVIVFATIETQAKIKSKVSYYTFKLYCIEKIENDNKV